MSVLFDGIVPIYKVENSSLMKWALEESCGFYSESLLAHYCIVTEMEMIDIVSMCEPTITMDAK